MDNITVFIRLLLHIYNPIQYFEAPFKLIVVLKNVVYDGSNKINEEQKEYAFNKNKHLKQWCGSICTTFTMYCMVFESIE